MAKVSAPTATIVPIRGSSRSSDRAGRDDEDHGEAQAEPERTPKRCRAHEPGRALRLYEGRPDPHVAERGRERRQRNGDRRGAVVGRPEKARENYDGGEADALNAGRPDELPEDSAANRMLYLMRRSRLARRVQWCDVVQRRRSGHMIRRSDWLNAGTAPELRSAEI